MNAPHQNLKEEVSNSRLQLIRMEHPVELTKMLQGLASRGFLDQIGQKRGTSYRLASWTSPLTPATPPLAGGTPPFALATPPLAAGTPPLTEHANPVDDPQLFELAKPARDKPRLMPERTKQIIRELCRSRFLTSSEIGSLMNRGPEKLREKFLSSMVDSGELQLRFPDEPNHPDQAYTTKVQP